MIASGPGASATINTTTVTQTDFRAAVQEIHKAVISHENELGDAAYEYFTEILLKLRKLELRHESMEGMLSQVKESADDLWVKAHHDEVTQTAIKKGLKMIGKTLPGQAVKAIVGVLTPEGF